MIFYLKQFEPTIGALYIKTVTVYTYYTLVFYKTIFNIWCRVTSKEKKYRFSSIVSYCHLSVYKLIISYITYISCFKTK